jgi:hypothetical protein
MFVLFINEISNSLKDREYDVLEVLSKDADFLYNAIDTYQRYTEIQ